ncbi:hypothetical protein HER21_08895 [Pseudomonas sp. BGM005]|nr:hypothetical protein [Pseudomonas sp. BG5]
MSTQDHPVWDVYDLLRTARLNQLYYGRRLLTFERRNFWAEIAVASTSSTSAIGAFAFWKTTAGQPYWQFFLAVAAVVAIAKPFLNYAKKIKSYEELLIAYRLIAYDLRDLRLDISQARGYEKVHQARFKAIKERLRTFVDKSPERVEMAAVKKICEQQVLSELPNHHFYIPGALSNE